MGKWSQKKDAPKYLRTFLFGESGTKKTRLVLEFPSPALIPLERGQQHYRDEFDFIELESESPDGWTFQELLADIKKLKDPTNHPIIESTGKKIETLIIDTIGMILAGVQGLLYDEQVEHILRSRRQDKDSVGFKDWGDMKRHYSELLEALDSLPLNVVVLGRMKRNIDTKQLVEFADPSTEYFFDIVMEARHLEKEHLKLKVWKDRTGHYKRHEEIRDPTYESVFKPIFDDLQSGKTKIQQESGGKPVKPAKAVETKPEKETPPKKPEKGKKPTKSKESKKPAKGSKKSPKETDDYVIGKMTVSGGKQIEYWSPKNTNGKRGFLINIYNKKKHPLWTQLNKMIGGSADALLPQNNDNEAIDSLWEMLIENNSEMSVEISS